MMKACLFGAEGICRVPMRGGGRVVVEGWVRGAREILVAYGRPLDPA